MIWLFQGLILPLILFLLWLHMPVDAFLGWAQSLIQVTLPLSLILPMLGIMRNLVDRTSLELLRTFLRQTYRRKLFIKVFFSFYLVPVFCLVPMVLRNTIPGPMLVHALLSTLWIGWLSYALSVYIQDTRVGLYSSILYVILNVFIGDNYPNFPMYYTSLPLTWENLCFPHFLYSMISILAWLCMLRNRELNIN